MSGTSTLASTAPRWFAELPLPGNSLLIGQSPDQAFAVGLRRLDRGSHPLTLESDEVVFVISGRMTYRSEAGETSNATPETLLHLPGGWSGEVEVAEEALLSWARCSGARGKTVSQLSGVLSAAPLTDWGVIPTMIEGESRVAGILLSRDPDRRAESGIWTCTPGLWRCEVTSDEFCHFLAGESIYMHDSGEVIEVRPGTVAYFPQGWTGTCAVRRTIRKVYLIR